MKNYLESIKLLIRRLLYLTVFYSICRILFVFFQYDSFEEINLINFIGGIRFDLSVIVYSNVLIILGHILPGRFKFDSKYQKLLKVLFFGFNIILLATNFVDFIYYDFTGIRSTFNLITAEGMEKEFSLLILNFLTQYWYVLTSFIIFGLLFWKWIPSHDYKNESQKESSKQWMFQSFVFVAMLIFFLVIARGGLQPKPIDRIDAVDYADEDQTAVVLNTPFCIMKTLFKKEKLPYLKYFDEDQLNSIYNPVKKYESTEPFTKKNIVIIILESFGDENVSFSNPKIGNTPFLDSLITKSLYFPNGYANGRVSIDALPSILSGIPSIFGESYITSSYAFNNVESLPLILSGEGYETSFFHGAFNGSQNFDYYASIAGFDNYYGKNEYPYSGHYDGYWGIYDEDFFQFFSEKLDTMTPPFLSSIFTISSHIPFSIPEKYKGEFGSHKSEFYESVGYTDYSLKRFFESVKNKAWYNNTLFVITADHVSPLANQNNLPPLKNYLIPILFFDPSKMNHEINTKEMQQIDIMSSILNYLNYSKDFVSYGNSYQSPQSLIINLINEKYHCISDNCYFVFDGLQITELYDLSLDPKLERNLVKEKSQKLKELSDLIKAYLQSFHKNFKNDTLISSKLKLQSASSTN